MNKLNILFQLLNFSRTDDSSLVVHTFSVRRVRLTESLYDIFIVRLGLILIPINFLGTFFKFE